MATRRTGRVIYKTDLAPGLAVFRVRPEAGHRFPTYRAGQYIALGRDDVPLTRRIGTDDHGRPVFGPDVDETGRRRIGSVMHAYSIASAPWETESHGYLEFYVVQDMTGGVPGRLSTVFLGMPCSEDEPVNYVDRVAGHFTLETHVGDARSVLLIGTGTGLSPFVSMVKQLHHAGADDRSYTLIHTNRTYAELGYHRTLLDIEDAATFDFHYIATVSRPTERDRCDPRVGAGRANNVLRLVYDVPTAEEERVGRTQPGRPAQDEAKRTLARRVRPTLPQTVSLDALRTRVDPAHTVIFACGNPGSTSDIQATATRVGVEAVVEAW